KRPRHRRQESREPDRDIPERRDDARFPEPAAGGQRDSAGLRGGRRRSEESHARSRRNRDDDASRRRRVRAALKQKRIEPRSHEELLELRESLRVFVSSWFNSLMPISEHLRKTRAKVGHDLLVLPGVTALVINDRKEILVHRSKDTGLWHTIGGIPDPGEEPADAIVREVFEEAGVHVVPERIVGVYTTPL